MEGIASGIQNRMTKNKLTKLVKSLASKPEVRNAAIALFVMVRTFYTKKKP